MGHEDGRREGRAQEWHFHRLSFALTVGLVLAAGAGALPAQEVRRIGATRAAVKLDGRVEIPFQLVPRHIQVEVRIKDSGPYSFILDTAAGLSVIDKSLAEKLELSKVGDAQVGDATANANRAAPLYKLEQLQVGGASWAGGAIVGMDLSELFDNEPDRPAGILGIALFADCLLTLDYAHQRVVLEPGALPEPDGKQVLPCSYARGLPAVKVELAGKPLELTIDCGASTSLALDESLKGSIPLASELTPVSIAKRMNSEATMQDALAAGDLVIGSTRIQAPRVAFAGTRSVVGFDVLRYLELTFDRKNERLRLRSETTSIKQAGRIFTGFGTKYEDGKRRVRWVLPGLAADKAGVKVDDEIVSIDGKPNAEWKRTQIAERLEKPGKLMLELKRGGEMVTATLELAPLEFRRAASAPQP